MGRQDTNGGAPVSVVGRVTRLLDAFDASTPVLALPALTQRCGLPKSTVHRMAEQLVDEHWLDRTPLGYRLGLRFLELGGLVAGRNHLRDRALPYLQDLQQATGHTIHLALLAAGEVVIVEKVWGHRSPVLPTRVGSHLPAHATALGKALLAFANEADVEAVLAGTLDRRTGRTVVVPEVLRQQLQTARTTNWTLEDEENIVGVRCVAAPIRGSGRAVAAVSASGQVHGFDVSRVVPLVRRCAADIWGQLIGRPAPAGGDGTADGGGPWDIEQWRSWLDHVAGEWL